MTLKVPTEERVEYKFIVDGEWRHSEHHPTVYNPFGTLNNVLFVPRDVAQLISKEFVTGMTKNCKGANIKGANSLGPKGVNSLGSKGANFNDRRGIIAIAKRWNYWFSSR